MHLHVGIVAILLLVVFFAGRWTGRKAEIRERGWQQTQGDLDPKPRMRSQAEPRARRMEPADLDDALAALLRKNQKISAIKVYRDETGAGLKDSKDYVDELALKLGLD